MNRRLAPLLALVAAGCATTAAVVTPPPAAPAPVPEAAARAAPGPRERVRAIVEETLRAWRLPSLSVAVTLPGGELIAEAAGLADVEHEVGATPATVYRVGSVSKPLTAAAALALAAEGRLDLDAPVQRTCPAYPAAHAGVTVRRLLGHLGGLRNYDEARGEFFSSRRYGSLTELVGLFAADPLLDPAGARFHYSAYGYDLAGCALEGAAGEPYEALVARRVLGPAGMTSTLLDRAELVVPHRARGYVRAGDGAWRNAPYADLSNRWPAGGWLSTPSDVARFARALLDGRLLPEGAREALWTSQLDADGTATGYGLGFSLAGPPREVFHPGSTVGASALLWLDPERGVAVALATNVQFWDDAARRTLARRLAEAVR